MKAAATCTWQVTVRSESGYLAVPTSAGIGLLHPHCRYCDSRIQVQTRPPFFCDCGTGCKQVKNARNATHSSSPTGALTNAPMHSPTSPPHPFKHLTHSLRARCRLCMSAHAYEGPATKSCLRNPPIQNIFIGLSCGPDQCGFN